MRFSGSAPRILDFDCEARPLSYLGSDFTTRELTAVAAQFIGEKKIHCWVLGQDAPGAILEGFRALYDQADIVAGHFIRSYDLPLIQSSLFELGHESLSPKLTSDTKNDLLKFSGISKSQEAISAMLGISAPKVHMTQVDWREANRLTPQGLAKTRRRVIGDVRQNIQMRAELLRRGMLGAPKVWLPESLGTSKYTP